MKQFTRYPVLLLLAVLVFAFVAADGVRIVQYYPRSTHIFRQSDCLAYTRRYYQDHSGFFSPACYNLIGKDGKVVSEFPVLYYISAGLCRLFGFRFWLLRGVTWAVSLLGLVYLFLITRRYVRSTVLSLFPVVILATTPFFFFYTVNFLPNVPAIALSFAGMYYMLRYGDTERRSAWWAGTLLLLIAALLKPTDGGLVWLSLLAAFLLGKERAAVTRRGIVRASFLVAAGTLAWLLFVRHYNHVNGNEINLQGFYPIWDMPWDDVYTTVKYRLFEAQADRFHHWFFLWISLLSLLFYIVKWRSLHPFLRVFTLFTLLGAMAYMPLWFRAFGVHDYYLLILVIPAVFVSITVSEYVDRAIRPRLGFPGRLVAGITCSGLMVASIYFNQYIQLQRYSDENIGFRNIDVINELGPYLRSIGIDEHETILSVGDGSPNITLAAMGNKGYASDLFGAGKYNAAFAVSRGLHYMVLLDPGYLADSLYAPYTHKKVGQYKFIGIYDLR